MWGLWRPDWSDLHFFDERHGLVVGSLDDGASDALAASARSVILETTDGGETWVTRYTSTERGQRCWKIAFPSPQVGYVTTEGRTAEGVVLKTTDGGQSWTKLHVQSGLSFEGVGFVTNDHGWIGQDDTLYETKDGGTTWGKLNFSKRVNRMRVLSPELVYAVGLQLYRWTPPADADTR